jgi:hypothetical protein
MGTSGLRACAPPGTHAGAFGFQRDDDGRGFLVHRVQVRKGHPDESRVLVNCLVRHGDVHLAAY